MILAIYLTAASLFGLALMGIDKHRAKTRRWRISEKMLFLTAALGGSRECGQACICSATRRGICPLSWGFL